MKWWQREGRRQKGSCDGFVELTVNYVSFSIIFIFIIIFKDKGCFVNNKLNMKVRKGYGGSGRRRRSEGKRNSE